MRPPAAGTYPPHGALGRSTATMRPAAAVEQVDEQAAAEEAAVAVEQAAKEAVVAAEQAAKKAAKKAAAVEPTTNEDDDEDEDEDEDEEEKLLRKGLVAEGLGHLFFGPTAAEAVDASLSGRALSRRLADAKVARARRRKCLLQLVRNARKRRLAVAAATATAAAAAAAAKITAAHEEHVASTGQLLQLEEPRAAAPAETTRLLRQPKPTPRCNLGLGKLHKDVRVGRGHQANVPVWSPHGPKSRERSTERRVQVIRRQDLRQQGVGTKRRRDAYRGFFLPDDDGRATSTVDPDEDWAMVVDPDAEPIPMRGVPPPLRPARPRRLSTRARVVSGAACSSALAAGGGGGGGGVSGGVRSGGGGGEAAHARASVATGAPALGSAWGYRERGTNSPLLLVAWADGEEVALD